MPPTLDAPHSGQYSPLSLHAASHSAYCREYVGSYLAIGETIELGWTQSLESYGILQEDAKVLIVMDRVSSALSTVSVTDDGDSCDFSDMPELLPNEE
ncbi:hypothetical protein VKT23_016353 [Stygiomarasmius scandens]|uniref:Uncharacterized protein n=1 Tax=Marasmiellus scandens TaxID=2682957 RepID=A0ABR1IXL2_9AGAR